MPVHPSSQVKRQLGIELQPPNLEMDADISSLGEFEVPLRLPTSLELPDGKVKLYLRVKVRRK